MCGRYTLTVKAQALARQLGIDGGTHWQEGVQPRYNIAPGQGILAIYEDANRDCRSADFFHWGLVPGWMKDPNSSRLAINARAETAAEKPSFKEALRYRRCLIPASGWYEWKRSGSLNQPWYMRQANNELLMFAGLWEHWQEPGGSEIMSACILTMPPIASLAKIHPRMPAVLLPEVWQDWLEPRNQDPDLFKKCFRKVPGTYFEAHPVSEAVNRTDQESPELIEPVADRSSDQMQFNW